ncbi:uncharacterized protein K460DRAFT_415630 [Cucurbitaria berberidis CBS 394.84]|uniref:ABM domain-containing protein n=1 Tax=Cucurbitaria berberidis CBS 394.84 TaxID=1168544 RepID=A0A9P4GPJ7_9PLEO|nr:uncharacterized protein K460DRAFT_415630 [Cucurbitaria berberidis CBS 394.84]KAF1849224.1 hypothetical protein K460DRAFT_415630 [Cucurbitaria berberidis CBS 394.84]
MKGLLTTARIVCKSPEARKTVIDAFRKIIAYTAPNEPEVLQYVCAVPLEDKTETEIYMIEEYTSQAASDAHLATQPVQDLITLFTTSDVLAQAPEVHNGSVAVRRSSGLPVSSSSNPAIALANVGYKAGNVVEEWGNVARTAIGGVKGFNLFMVVEDKDASSVRAVYVLDSWGAYKEFEQGSGVNKTGVAELVKIKAVDGFIGREDRSKL